MIKYFFYLSLSLLFFNSTLAKDVDIQEDINLSFVCDLEKKILKNSEYNYKTFLAQDTHIIIAIITTRIPMISIVFVSLERNK